MTKPWESVAVFIAGVFAAAPALAQPNLPPPPPPPIDQPSDVPALPPPPPGPGGASTTSPGRRTQPAPPPPARVVRPAPVRPRRADDDLAIADAPPPPAEHPLAVTLNPIGLFWGRLSVNVEYQVQPHHSLFVSPNALFFETGRGSVNNVISQGLGFASPASLGLGTELGYHYWWVWSRALRGPFIGPALLFGLTSHAQVGNDAHVQGYWGLALDVGWQEVLGGGFTAGIGAGLEFIDMAGAGRVVPRLLVQVGWSF